MAGPQPPSSTAARSRRRDRIYVGGTGLVSIINSGLIAGLVQGINNSVTEVHISTLSRLSLIKTGTVQGTNYVVGTGNLTDVIINRSDLIGNVDPGGGADSFDNRNGWVSSIVFGGEGNGLFIGSASITGIFNVGAGADTLDFRLGGSVIIALDLSRPKSGQAIGDTCFQFENIFGSQSNDIIAGDNTATC